MTNTTTQSYLIPECNLAELEARVEKLNKRARRLNVPEVVVTKAPDHVRHRVRQLTVDGHVNSNCWRRPEDMVKGRATGTAFLADAWEATGEVMAWWSVTVTGETPRLNGWDFIATLEPLKTEDGEVLNLVQAVPGKEVPAAYRNDVGRCDHCNVARRRSQTFVLKNDAGEHKVVGRMCLKDFLGYHGDPQAFASWAESLGELAGLCEAAEDDEWLGGGGGYRERSWDLKRVLTLTACRIRMFGWVSRGKAYEMDRPGEATANNVLYILTPPPPNSGAMMDWQEFVAEHVITDADGAEAEAAIEWAKAIPADECEGSNYLANCNLIARVGTVSHKTAGIACSILVAYAKAREKEINRQKWAARPVSNWVGTVGERIQMIEVTCEKVIMSEGRFGVTGIHKLVDAAGNDLVWFASAGEVIKAGEKATIAGTVKEHGEFRERKQTVLTRVEVWTEQGLAAAREKAAKKAEREAKKAEREAKKAAKAAKG